MKSYAYAIAVIAFILIAAFLINTQSGELSGSTIANPATGKVALAVLSQDPQVNITSPKENEEYQFSVGQEKNLTLNVTADREINNWWFELYDLKYDELEREKVAFVPNTTFEAVRHRNNLTVYANSTEGNVGQDSVVYNVSVPNSAPDINNLSKNQYACENKEHSEKFKVEDLDEDPITPSISPTGPFYISPLYVFGGDKNNSFEVFSGTLDESDLGNYSRTVSVTDNYNSTCCADNQEINITVLELNDRPSMENLDSKRLVIGTPNDTFSKTVDVEDEESKLENITFNASFSGNKLFSINDSGEINYTASDTSNVGNHDVEICAEDSGLANPHQNLSQCNADGSSKKDCQNLTLFITEPDSRYFLWFYISDFYPKDKESQITSSNTIDFSVETESSRSNSSNVTWKLNSSNGQDQEGKGKNFSYEFKCENPGNYTVTAKATDGRASDQIIWEIEVPEEGCRDESPSSGSGGGGSGGGSGGSGDKKTSKKIQNQTEETICRAKWACGNWSECFKASTGNERKISDCEKKGIPAKNCGYMERTCEDINSCNVVNRSPEKTRACNYGRDATCSDGVKNCHSGSCEVLVDCGGPCKKCASCSDGIQNQGEEGIDCGGPCTKECKNKQKPLPIGTIIIVIVLLILLIAILIYFIKKERNGNS